MKKIKIPTLVGLFVLITSLAAALFAIQEFKFFKSEASASVQPRDVKITNLSDSSFTVTWLTDTPTIGYVEYSNSVDVKKTAPTPNSKTHFVNITNLDEANLYTFKLNSNGQYFTKDTGNWSAQTLSSQLQYKPLVISGQVLNQNGFPVKEGLVFVDVLSLTFSTQIAISGNWTLSLPSILPDTTLLQILVETSTSSIALAKVEIKGANPIPPIKIGNSYDFRNQENINVEESPKVPLTL